MKMILLFLAICSVHGLSAAAEPEVATLRKLFYAAEKSKSAWLKLKDAVKPIGHNAKPIYLCYIGITEMMGAKYVFSPISKFNRFKKGKILMEQAVAAAPNDVEIRFLRFSVQTNLPSFLGYDEDINEDKKVLLDKYSKISDKDLKINILKYLTSSKYCSAEEKKRLVR